MNLFRGLQQMVAPPSNSPPTFYNGWFNGEIENAMAASIRAAKADGIQNMEVTFFPVPNPDEVKFGTPLNQRFGKKVAAELKMTSSAKSGVDVLVSRYLSEFSNHYWATMLAESPVLGGGTKHIVHCDAVKKDSARKVASARVLSFNAALKEQSAGSGKVKGKDPVILVGLGSADQWRKGQALSEGGPVVALNGLFSETYDLGGPLTAPVSGGGVEFEPVYYLKRVSKGYAFRAYPNGWQAWIELPDLSVKLLKDWGDERPSLNQVAGLVRNTSNKQYGVYNDRYAPGFGERL